MISDKMDKIALSFAKVVEKAIIAGEFEVLERDQYIVKLSVENETVDVWMANTTETTALFRIILSEHESYRCPDRNFSKPELCREILSELSNKEIAENKAELEKKIAELKELTKMEG